jgi:thioredoxin 1
MKIVTDKDFEQEVMNNEKPVVIDIFTTWCPPCKMLAPILEKLAEDYEGKVVFVKMDLDQSPMTGNAFQVDRIPTVMLFDKGELVSSFIGLREEKDIREWIDSSLNK